MFERRRQAASLVALLVVTPLFVWSCSSSDHEDASVTTSGGAGSEVRASGSPRAEAGTDAELASGGTRAVDAAGSIADGGSADAPTAPNLEPSLDHDADSGSGGAASEAGPARATGGSSELSAAGFSASAADSGAAAAGTAAAGMAAAGAAAAGGPPAALEPVCDPADDHSTPDMFLPCDVSTALYVCRNCHANPPVKGVFSSYVTYADIKANAAQIYGVIKSGTMPRPPYTLSAWQKSTALKWLGKNGSCAIGATKSCQ